MTLGPLEYLVLGFNDTEFDGTIAHEIQKVVERGIIRLIDVVAISKDSEGTTLVAELDRKDDPRFASFAGLLKDRMALFTEEDLQSIADHWRPGRPGSRCCSSTAGPRTSRRPSRTATDSSSLARSSRRRSSKRSRRSSTSASRSSRLTRSSPSTPRGGPDDDATTRCTAGSNGGHDGCGCRDGRRRSTPPGDEVREPGGRCAGRSAGAVRRGVSGRGVAAAQAAPPPAAAPAAAGGTSVNDQIMQLADLHTKGMR